MKKWMVITLVVNLIFLINQFHYFFEVNPYAPTAVFAVGFFISIFLYLTALFFFIKFHRGAWKKLDLAATAVSLLSMGAISLIGAGIDVSMGVAGYSAYGSILLGIIGWGKYRQKWYAAFLLYGIFALLWTANWYESNYLDLQII